MLLPSATLQELWRQADFTPNDSQREAILHTEGPLYLTAGPGSGKTRVLLWRTVNLVAFQKIDPCDILLTTFTEKAAFQLKEGLQSYLGMASNLTGVQYDVGAMYIGTVHSICRKLLQDRRFSPDRDRRFVPKLMDQLEQYFFIKKRRIWDRMLAAAQIEVIEINAFFQKKPPDYPNRHRAIQGCINLFNRFSEERIDPVEARSSVDESETLYRLLRMYQEYLLCLEEEGGSSTSASDFSLIQEKALRALEAFPEASRIFRHVIVDEYQDTNYIQEQLYFTLAGNQNICVVGDDDQALYRFRGATVENFVEFPQRVRQYLGDQVVTTKIPLSINYRSRKQIVDFYTQFIEKGDWQKAGDPNEQYRVHDKGIRAFSTDSDTALLTTAPGDPHWCTTVAQLCRRLVDQGVVHDPNQIAFLFPSVKNKAAQEMMQALQEVGLNVYAPRAGRFLEVPEACEMFGLFTHVFGAPDSSQFSGREFDQYKGWLKSSTEQAKTILNQDRDLQKFVSDRRAEIARSIKDYGALLRVVQREGWDVTHAYNQDQMRRKLSQATNLSVFAQGALTSPYLARIVNERARDDKEPDYTLQQILVRITSLDWSILDLFYQLCGFNHFKRYYDLAQNEGNEGPISNLSLVTDYLSRFMEIYSPVLTASFLQEEAFSRLFFSSYLYTIYRLGESEFEDEENPFPRGNISFLTVHQAKGLEFPVVFLYPSRYSSKDDTLEKTVRRIKSTEGEPLEKIGEFDLMRMYYVALSRAEQLLIIPNLDPKGFVFKPLIATLRDHDPPLCDSFDLNELPPISEAQERTLAKPYSYTADYQAYERCPRQYMIFRKYGMVPSRTQTMFFGSLVHNTIEDLHQYLIQKRTQA